MLLTSAVGARLASASQLEKVLGIRVCVFFAIIWERSGCWIPSHEGDDRAGDGFSEIGFGIALELLQYFG